MHILQITPLVRFLSAKRAFSFAQMVKIYIFYATRPHAIPLTGRLNAQFGKLGICFSSAQNLIILLQKY